MHKIMKTIISQLNLQVYHWIFFTIMISNRYIIMNLIFNYQGFWAMLRTKYVKPKSKHIIYKISIQKYSKPIHDFILGCKLFLLTQKGNRQCNIYWKQKFWPVSFHRIVWFKFICGNFNINADHELKKSALSEHKINWSCGLFNALVKGQ